MEQIASLGTEHLRKQIEPSLPPTEAGKFVAIDVDRGKFEVHQDDLTALNRLQDRIPGAVTFLGRVGQPFTYRTGRRG